MILKTIQKDWGIKKKFITSNFKIFKNLFLKI